ncbi:hypothetical protein [Kitasatospora sp. P5_F3]
MSSTTPAPQQTPMRALLAAAAAARAVSTPPKAPVADRPEVKKAA